MDKKKKNVTATDVWNEHYEIHTKLIQEQKQLFILEQEKQIENYNKQLTKIGSAYPEHIQVISLDILLLVQEEKDHLKLFKKLNDLVQEKLFKNKLEKLIND